jgi:hypothetical protein
MNKFILSGLVLISSTADATETRANSLENNLGMADDTDYQMFANTTGDAGDSVTLDVNGEVLTGAMMFGANAVTIGEGQFGSHLGWHHSSGDSGFSVGLDMGSTENFALDGSYSMARGDANMANIAFGGGLAVAGEDSGFNAGVMSRALSDSHVTAWGADIELESNDINLDGMYAMGWVMASDASKAALTIGPKLDIDIVGEEENKIESTEYGAEEYVLTEDGEPETEIVYNPNIEIALVAVNIAGEFMFNDWIGIRGGVIGSLNITDVTDDLGVSTTLSATMGGTFKSDAGDIDLMYTPGQLLGGPHFITGAGTGAAVMLSARFAI